MESLITQMRQKPELYVTGIGSRETPAAELQLMEDIGFWAAEKGYTGRSGHADGSDYAFERGYIKAGLDCKFEAYLPWEGFNKPFEGNPDWYINAAESDHFQDATKMVEGLHLYWENVKQGGRKLHGRNPFQILGKDLKTPSSCVFYYAEHDKEGQIKGGTRTAVVLANRLKIPSFNLYLPYVREFVSSLIHC